MKSLMWLASYPKSGNTWMRAFLANYVFNLDQPVPVNQLHKLGIGDADAAAHTRAARGRFNPNDPRDTVRVRRILLDAIDSNGADLNFIKTHNQNSSAFGVDLVPRKQTRGAIHIVRDPRDMALSFASHHGMSIDETIHRLNRKDNATSGNSKNVHQFVGSWSDHVKSWTRPTGFPVLTARYEDLLADPAAVFSAVLRHIGLDIDRARLEKAIEFASFDQLKAQEQAHGFVENSEHQEAFFRSGRAGAWRDEMTRQQARQIEADHRRVMRKHGYLG